MPKRERYVRLPPTAKPVACLAALSETYDWALTNDGIPEIWKETRGKGVKIAAFDTGVSLKHPDLVGQIQDAEDFTGSPIGPEDSNGHGTFVSGQLVAKCGNDIGTAGLCYEAHFGHFKVLNDSGAGDERAIGRGFQRAAEKGYKIFSASFGGRGMSKWLFGLLKELHDQGVIMFFACGNDAGPVNEPAAWPWGISVGASDEHGDLTAFTSKVGRMDIVAPGVNRISTAPGGRYATMAGTSMATPHAAGVSGLALAKHLLLGGDSDMNNRADTVEHLQGTAADRGTYKLLNPRKLLERHGVAPPPAERWEPVVRFSTNWALARRAG